MPRWKCEPFVDCGRSRTQLQAGGPRSCCCPSSQWCHLAHDAPPLWVSGTFICAGGGPGPAMAHAGDLLS